MKKPVFNPRTMDIFTESGRKRYKQYEDEKKLYEQQQKQVKRKKKNLKIAKK